MPDILIKLVNASLLSGSFPSSQRHALVTPVLKKPHLDPSVPNNYRPISNLSFISKLLQRVVARQLTTRLATNGLIPALQSAYRRNHSTETALLKICNDALMAADNGMVTLVVLLDYTLPNLTRSTTPSCWTSWSDDVGSQTMHYGGIRATSTVVRTPSPLAVLHLKLLTSAAVYYKYPVLARLSLSSTLQIFML